jgi:hypothetical protein
METVFACPHCNELIDIQTLNCGIFRHAVDKITNEQFPHASEEMCMQLLAEGKIFGCGKPIRVILENAHYVISKCDFNT